MASLEWSPEVERAVDRVAASGKSSPLGLAIWKAKYCLESSAYQEATKLLTEWFLSVYTGEQKWLGEKIAEQSLYEFVFEFCHDCSGIGEIVVEELKVACPACNGSRLKRYSDKERCQRMKISWALTKALSRKMQRAMGKIFDEDRLTNYALCVELGRST